MANVSIRKENRITGRWVTINAHISGANTQYALTIEIKQLNSRSSNRRQRNNVQAVSRPNEVIRPLVLAWIEERDILTCLFLKFSMNLTRHGVDPVVVPEPDCESDG